MYFVVAGAGEVGLNVARTLREEGHEVAIIEGDPQRVRQVEGLDALMVEGNAASPAKLEEVEIRRADVFIAVTGQDEVNMVAAMLAKQYGCKTIARMNNPDYLAEPWTGRYRQVGIDVAVCPELVAADRISQTLEAPSLMSVDVFAENRVHVGEIRIDTDSPAVGKRISELDVPRGVNLIAVRHDGDTRIARGDVMLHGDARVLLAMARPELVFELERFFGKPHYVPATQTVERVMIGGATRIGVHLAHLLERRMEVILVDEDEERCKQATETLDKTLVIHGNATDRKVLLEEDIDAMDAFVGSHQVEEYNILSCLLARSLGVDKTVALINQPELRDLVESVHVDLAINPKAATVGTVLRHVHQAEFVDYVLTRTGDAQLMEVRVHDDARVAGKTLKKARLPPEAIVAAIVRDDEVIVPRGDDMILAGDRLVIYARPEAVTDVERLL